jgi:hypothetical protein
MDNRTKVTAETIYTELVENFDIKNKIGSINLTLGDILVKYNGRDAVGHLLQEWISEWLKSKNYYFRTKPNTQEFPDLLLTDNDKTGLLEIKTFNASASPAFDIANFTSYCKSLLDFPERLNADYLILGYEMENGELKIKDVWLKKVWELAGTSGTNPINLQTKDSQPYNLRPVTWYSTRQTTNKPFTDKIEFLNAIKATHEKYPEYTSSYNDDWLSKVKTKYKEKFDINLG